MRWLAILLLLGAALSFYMFAEARRMPVMRTATLALPGYPAGVAPLRIALLTDTHMGGPDETPERLERIVAALNAQRPDLVLLGGDYIGEPKGFGAAYSHAATVAPFAHLKARLGVVAVLGNHDHWDDAAKVAAALRRVGVTILSNQAVQRGPLVIGGIDDAYTKHASVAATLRAMRGLTGAPLFLSHGPDIFPALPSGSSLLVGHTHCGQIVLPLIGPQLIPSRYGARYACGRYEEGGKTMIVSGGVGTSVLPLRLGAPPDYWLVTVGRAKAVA